MNIRLKQLGAFAVAALLALPSAFAANVVSGQMWQVPDAIAQSATLANVPARSADVTFDVASPLNFDSPDTVLTFLNSGSAFNIVEHTAGVLSSLISDGTSSSLFSFSGFVTVTMGQMFTATHDDGLTLIIGGLDLGFNSGPTSPTTSTFTYTGPSGTFPFQLVYGECCSGSAVLQVDLPFANAVPEPASAWLLLAAGAALFANRRRAAQVRVAA